jgi:hypothetical protein
VQGRHFSKRGANLIKLRGSDEKLGNEQKRSSDLTEEIFKGALPFIQPLRQFAVWRRAPLFISFNIVIMNFINNRVDLNFQKFKKNYAMLK